MKLLSPSKFLKTNLQWRWWLVHDPEMTIFNFQILLEQMKHFETRRPSIILFWQVQEESKIYQSLVKLKWIGKVDRNFTISFKRWEWILRKWVQILQFEPTKCFSNMFNLKLKVDHKNVLKLPYCPAKNWTKIY